MANPEEIFESEVRSAGDLAGVYEFDGDVCFFYLYAPEAPEGKRILGAIRIVSGTENQPSENDLQIRWDAAEEYVGLLVGKELWAVFDGKTRKGYADGPETPPSSRIPKVLRSKFEKPKASG